MKKHASNADRQRAYRERKRNAAGVTLEAARASWRREFYHVGVLALLEQVAEAGGVEAAQIAVAAIKQALTEERAWAAFRSLGDTREGHRLKQLVNRRDSQIAQFLQDITVTD